MLDAQVAQRHALRLSTRFSSLGSCVLTAFIVLRPCLMHTRRSRRSKKKLWQCQASYAVGPDHSKPPHSTCKVCVPCCRSTFCYCQAFSEMDFNRDGEVSFDEFVRWYSMSSALDEPQQAASGTTPTVAANGEAAPPTSPETALARTGGFATDSLATAAANSRVSRLLADVEKTLALTGSSPTTNQPPRLAAVGSAQAGAASDQSSGVETSARGQLLTSLAPPSASLAAVATAAATGAGLGSTEEEKETARERWLAGGAADAGPDTFETKSADGGDLAAEDLDKALSILCVLVKARADADTLVAALASQIIRNPMGRYNLEVIEEQFGPIIRGIVEDRLLLERLPEPTSSTSYLAIQQVTIRGMAKVVFGGDRSSQREEQCPTSASVSPMLRSAVMEFWVLALT